MFKRILLGFVVALVLGAGTGAALKPVAKALATPVVADARPPRIDHGLVQVETAVGTVQVLTEHGDWRAVEPDKPLSRPAMIRTVGDDARVVLSFKGIRAVGEHDARFLLSAPGPDSTILVYDGHVRVHRSGTPLTVYVPDREVKLIGQTFGVWVRGTEVTASVLDADLEVHPMGKKPIKFARGREIRMSPRRALSPALLDQQLQIQVQGISRRGYRYTLTGRTAAHAVVVQKLDDGRERIQPVSPAGVFSVDLLDRRPQPGQLVVYDSAGRRAEVDKPSRTLVEVVQELSGLPGPGEPDAATPPPSTEPTPAAAAEPPASATPPPAEAAPPPAAPPAAKPTPRERKPKPDPRVEAVRGKAPPEPVKLDISTAKLPRPKLGADKPLEKPAESSDAPPVAKPKPPPVAKPKPPPAKAPPPPEPTEPADEEAL